VRRICAFTGNRAEYGLLHPILVAMRERGDLDVRLIVSGAHVAPEFGRTITEIEADGIPIAATVDLGVEGAGVQAQTVSLGRAIAAFAEVLAAQAPDLALVYADRMEGFAAAIASFEMNVPLAHVEGGDLTEGGTHDDSVRHAMTKLAHLHFTTSEAAAARVRRLGEEPWRVTFAGLPTLDSIARKDFARPEEVYRTLDLDPARPVLVFTQHPVTTEAERAGAQAVESLEALEAVGEQTVVTYPNSDPGSRLILEAFDRYRDVPHFRFHPSLGRRRYLGLLAVAAAVVGNSSSGLKETPSFGIPCVNIGPRQEGRLRAENVLDVPCDRAAIIAAVRRALHDETVRARARRCRHPYGEGRAGEIIAAALATVELGPRLLRKRMTF
jgi:UDP-N-acetylglucosamine 2-epimerase (non-hydrolysing)/GDP/UDP-N,N'-diacetylbacillosamine 2-epimerase (hydrolysing)